MSSATQVPIHNIETKQLQATGFNIIDLSAKGGKSYDTNMLHRHTFFELFFFRTASGKHEIDFSSYNLEPNCVHFVSPGQIHKLILKKHEGFVICFTEEFVSLKPGESFIQNFPFFENQPPLLKLSKALAKDIGNLVTRIYSEFKALQPHGTELFRHYLNILLLKLRLHLQASGRAWAAADKNHKVTQFKKLVNDYYLEHKPVAYYAQELNISPNHLNALCKKHEGRSAIQLIQQRLTLEAKRLLYATDLSAKEISFQLRFEDTGYFNRFFKKETNLTPVRYRVAFSGNR
jgi:AraC-like DNA-binding protein